MKRLLILALSLCFALPVMAQHRQFYISTSGSNSNAGTQASPWRSDPYMYHSSACDGGSGPSGYVHQAGDQFMLKGGESWPNTCFPMAITAGGTVSTQDYHGVCNALDTYSPCYGGTSWPSTGWTQPKFAFANSQPVSGCHTIATSGAGANSRGLPYITLDNFEIANQGTCVGTGPDASAVIEMGGQFWSLSGSVGTIVANMYIHDWSSSSPVCTNGLYGNSCTPSNGYGTVFGAALLDNSIIDDANGYQVVYFTGGNVTYNPSPYAGGCEGCGEVRNSNIGHGWIGTSSSGKVHDNQFHDIQQNCGATNYQGIHSHVLYEDAGNITQQSTVAVYNNVLFNNNAGLNISVYYPTAIYNNVMWNNGNNSYGCTGGGNVAVELINGSNFGANDNGDSVSFVGNYYNNTFDQNQNEYSQDCWGWASGNPKALGTINQKNNICLDYNQSNPNGGYFNVTTLNQSNNRNMTSTEANNYGFTSANKYAPTSSDSYVTGAGVNLTSSCSGNLTALCKDTEGAPWYAGSYQTRPTSAAWTLGAYVWPVGGSSTPQAGTPVCTPGTGTYSGVQTVTCTNPSSAPVRCSTQNGTTPITDGATGCNNGTPVSGTISVTPTSIGKVLEVVAGGSGFLDSSPAIYTYTLSGAGTPPTVAITAPTDGATVSGNTTLTSTCVPTGGTIASMQFILDIANIGSAGTSSPYSTTWDTTKSANTAHTITTTCTDSNALVNSASINVTASNSMSGCFISSYDWSQFQTFPSQMGTFSFGFTATPFANNEDGVIGLSLGQAAAYNDLAISIRFNSSGVIDARNGTAYAAVNSIPYTAGTTYTFSGTANLSTHQYSVQVTSPSSVTLATNYAFRSTQSSVASLDHVVAIADDSQNTVQVCSFYPPSTSTVSATGNFMGSFILIW
jgi:hypothetical protein